jgi:hypothetical protein
MIGRDTKFFHDLVTRTAQPESIQANDRPVDADVLIPEPFNAGFDGNSASAASGQNALSIFL